MNKKLSGFQTVFLDVYRIVAALLVVLGHNLDIYLPELLYQPNYFPYIQNIGVVMLFLLSGFLTVYSIEKRNEEKNYKYSTFVKHKFLKIMKEYIPALLFIALIDYVSIRTNSENYWFYDTYSAENFLGNLLMLQWTSVQHIPNCFIDVFGTGRPLWTMSFEWWFYMLFGFVYLTLVNNKKITIKKAILFCILLIIPVEYIITGAGNGLGFIFLLGIFSYYLYDRLSYNSAWILFILSIIVNGWIAYAIKDIFQIYNFFTMWIIFTSALKISSNFSNMKRSTILSFVSQSTFMLYLTHYSITYFLLSKTNYSNQARFIIVIVSSIGLSFIMYYLFGKKELLYVPFRKLNDKYTQTTIN